MELMEFKDTISFKDTSSFKETNSDSASFEYSKNPELDKIVMVSNFADFAELDLGL